MSNHTSTSALLLTILLFTGAGCIQSATVTSDQETLTPDQESDATVDEVSLSREDEVPLSREDEYWQLQGSGHTYDSAQTIVDDGSTLAYALRYGEGSGDMQGNSKLYYNPNPTSTWGAGVRVATNHSTGTELDDVDSYEAIDAGIKIVCEQINLKNCSAHDAYWITASQAVPLASDEVVRLFFEASDMSAGGMTSTKIFSLDSQDGYVGEDFAKGSATVCGGKKSTDYAEGGACALTSVLDTNEETGLSQARQFKIGLPTLDTWLWDESPGTFMVITGADQCRQTNDGLFYAVWSGSAWEVVKDDEGCAQPLVPYAHGPVLVHFGEGRYKMYYEDIMSNVNLARVDKPLRFITADATRTGDPDLVDLADWDSYKDAGEVHFLWPDGRELSAADESGLGDHFIFTPDGLDSQVMYFNLGGMDNSTSRMGSRGLGVAIPVK
jgi:hypothetical protein